MALPAGSCRRTATLTIFVVVVLAIIFLALQIDLPWGSPGVGQYVSRLKLKGGAVRIRAFTDLGKLVRAREAKVNKPEVVRAKGSNPASVRSSFRAAPPLRSPGFQQWIRFAVEHECMLEPYERINRDLAQFAGGISPEMLEMAKQTPYTFTFKVKNGSLSFYPETQQYTFGLEREKYSEVINTFVQHLPDMEFVVNELDEPRVLPGSEDSLSVRYASTQCANASENFQKYRHLHGFVISPGYQQHTMPRKELLPIFSQSKIDGCYGDIGVPTWYNLGSLLSDTNLAALLPWEERIPTLFFRGSTSGGVYNKDVPYQLFHRQRLVELAKHSNIMDCKFTEFLQCQADNMCRRMQQEYGRAAHVPFMENYNHKYLILVDGNSFVSRTPRALSSGSLVFRSGIFSEWFEDRLIPHKHYIPVKLDYSDLEEKVQWAISHDDEAAAIAAAGQEAALSHLRDVDIACYMFRLLLEYSTLLKES